MPETFDAGYFSDLALETNEEKSLEARKTLMAVSRDDAERAAKASNLAQDIGIPKQAVEHDLEHYEQEKRFDADYFTRLGREYPSMVDFISDPDNAAIVHDDLTYLEKTAKTVMQVPGQVREGYYDVYLANLRNKQLFGGASERDIAKANELSQRKRTEAESTGFISDTVLKTAHQLPILGEVGIEATAYSVGAGATAFGLGQMGPQVAIPEEIVTVPVAMRIGGAYGAFNASRRLEGGLAFDEFLSFRDADGQPLEEDVARGAAIVVGITNGAVELIPLKMLVETVPGIEKLANYFTKDGMRDALKYPSVRDALSDIGQRYARAIVAEGSTEIAQEAVTMYTGELIKALDDGEFESIPIEEQVERLAEAGKAGAQVAVGLGFPGTVVRTGQVIAEQTGQPNPNDVAEYVRNVGESLADSGGKLMGRSKPKMREYIDGVTGEQTFYLDAGTTSALYQKMTDEQKMEILNAIPDFEASLDRAVRTQDSFEIPAADFFTYIQPYDAEGILDDYVTFSPEHYSAADLKEMDEMISDLMEEAQALEETQSDGDVVESNIYQQLLQNFSGRKAPSGRVDVARIMSQNPRAFYETMLSRADQDPRVKEIMDRLIRDVSIRRAVPNLDKVLKIDELDLALDRVRDRAARREAAIQSGESPDMFGKVKTKKKKGKAKPTPIISWLGKRGGVRSTGNFAKELAAMDITPKSHPRLFNTKGMGSADNIPSDEYNAEIGNDIGVVSTDETGYVDPEFLLEQIRRESFGEGALTQDQIDAETDQAYLDDIEQVMQMVGVDLDMPNADIKQALQQYQDDLGLSMEEQSVQSVSDVAADTQEEAEALAEKAEQIEAEEATQEEFQPEEKPEPIKPETPIEDFGEEIAGARKHEYVEKLSKELPTEAKDMTLGKHFPEPDYDKLIAAGVDIRILAAIKAMRDEIPNKPRAKWKLERWANSLKLMRSTSIDLIDGTTSIDKFFEKMKSPEFSSLRGVMDNIELYIELGYPTFKNAKGYGVGVAKSFIDEQGNKRDEPVDQWMILKDRSLLGGYDTREQAMDALRAKLALQPEKGGKRKTKLDIWQVRATGEIVIGKKVGSRKYLDLKTGFKDVKEARKYLNENEDALLVLLESKKKIAPVRNEENAPREGVDRRMGENISPEKFAREFGFRGVQFGNYVEQSKRARDLNESYDALLDMADIIGVDGRALSLNGSLGLAFGARGKGAAGGMVAAAHYESDHVVINLTKKSGAGSLGHEWWHALDNYFGKKNEAGDYLSEKPRQRKYGKNYEEIADADQKVRKEVVDAFKGVMDAINQTGMRGRATELDKKRSKTYWTTDREMSARAFESYLIHKADQKGERNDYLANIVKEDTWKALMEGEDAFPYLQPDEISQVVAPAFDKLFDVLQTRETEQGVEFYQKEQKSEWCGACDRFRKTEEGEAFWQKMMDTKKEISEEYFLSNVTIEDALDAGETWEDYKAGADDAITLYESDNAFFFQTAGFEFIWRKPDTLYQGEGDARGSIQFLPSGQSVIRLFEKEDLSTFMHEAGHLYWRAMSEIAALENAPEQIARDVSTVRKWVGAADGATLTVEQEEKIADAFLTYIRKGDAPSVDLQSAFQRMKAWLTRIYRGVRDTLPKINNEISDVFDRMLATDDAIERVQTEPAFRIDEAIMSLLPKAESDKMRRKMEKAIDVAKERILKKAIRQAESRATKTYKKERTAAYNRISKEVDEERTYAAMNKILEEGGLSRKAVTSLLGKEAIPYLSGHGGLIKKGGQHPDVYADILGYRNGYEMVMDFMNAQKKKERIEELVDRAMLERYGDMLNDGSIDDEAMRIYHDRLRKEIIAMEMKALAELGDVPAIDPEGIEAAAIKIVGDLSIGKLQPGRYLRAENRAHFAYGKALGQGNYARAARAKAQQLLNHHLYKMVSDKRETVEKTLKNWRRFSRPDKKIAKAKSINIDYVYAIRSILSRHDIGKSDYDFQTWFEQLRAENPDSAQTLASLINMNVEGAKPYKDLTVDEFIGLKDSIEGLVELGRDTLQIELEGKRLTTREAASAAAEAIYSHNKERDMTKHYESVVDKSKAVVSGFDKAVTRMEFILKSLEGNEMNGKLAQMFINPLAAADAKEEGMHREIAEKFKDILDRNDGVNSRWKQKVYDQRLDRSFTVRNIITIALNMGNEGNLEKLLDGYEWEYADVKELIERYLTEADMNTVQEIWDLMETLRPDLQRVHKEVTGFPMEVVPAMPLETKWGTYAGGYFPIVYDMKRSEIGARNAEDVSVFESNFTIPSVGKGMTKSRTSFSAPVDLDFDSIIAGHFAKTIHLITHGTAVKDINRIIMHPTFKEAIIKTAGTETYGEFKPWLQAVAANRVYDHPVKMKDKIVRHLRVATTNLFLGFSVSTGIKQTLGMTATYAATIRGEVTQKNFWKSLRQYYTDPANMSAYVMERSKEMQGRIREDGCKRGDGHVLDLKTQYRVR